MSFTEKCRRIRMILSDVDGVLTDGGVILSDVGDRLVQFHIRDGLGIRIWQESGGQFGLVTGRDLSAVRFRAEKLSIDIVRQGVRDKLRVVDEILAEHQLQREEVCFLGDDLPDLPVIRAVGLGVAVADAAEEVRQGADYITSVPGGRGAVREAIELLMKNAGRWDEATSQFTAD